MIQPNPAPDLLPKIVRKLKGPQSFKLCCWLQGNYAELAKTRPTKNEIAEIATKALGFPVCGGNVSNSLKSIGMKSFNPKRKLSEGTRKPLAILAAYLCDFADKIGHPVPQEVRDLTK